MSELALRLIAENKKTKEKRLELGNCGLTELPDELFECVWLEELILSNEWWEYSLETLTGEWKSSKNKGRLNIISTIPPEISKFINLNNLVISGKYEQKWPLKDLTHLKNLCHLNHLIISSTSVEDLNFLMNFKELQTLFLFNTNILDLNPLKDLNNLKFLSLGRTKINNIDTLARLNKLEQLFIYKTNITDLSALSELTELHTLSIHDTKTNDLEPLTLLTKLTKIYADNTLINNLNPIEHLSCLQMIEISNTNITNLEPITRLERLEWLFLSNTKVKDLSPLTSLSNLKLLDISNTEVEDLAALRHLKQLKSLYINNASIKDISPLSNFPQLETLSIANTRVKDISSLKLYWEKGINFNLGFASWEYGLKGIYLKNLPLDKSLIAAIKSGNDAIQKYFNKPMDQLWEARVLILGEPRAGKTTLRRKLKSRDSSMPIGNESTRGIEIEIETLKCKLVKDGQTYTMQYHLWDFGGQDMYRLLHQLFVAEQAVYIIVTDTDRNKNEEEIDFWLETIQRLGRDKEGNYGPVIVLQNPKTNREGSSFPELKKRYQELWKQNEDFTINLNKLSVNEDSFDKQELRRFQHFKEYLENSFHQLEHIGQKIPRQWIRIRKKLNILVDENWITLERFRKVCEKENIHETEEQNDLLNIFHILGFVLHYNNDQLKGMVILNKEWATDALYRVLDDAIVRRNKGWFVKEDAKMIWHDKKYQDRDNELLKLMEVFRLTYFNEHSRKYVVPSKLPEDVEGLPEWDKSNNVRLYLCYDWLPRPIATQLIVLLHDHIVQLNEREQWIWLRGAVLDGSKLDSQDAQVMILDNWKERRIELYARGASSEKLIRTIMRQWRVVHETYENKVSVKKNILCNCEKCQDLDKPFEFDYQEVLDAREAEDTLKCNKSRTEMSAADILRGIFDDATASLDALIAKRGETELLRLITDDQLEEALERLPNENEIVVALKANLSRFKNELLLQNIDHASYNSERGKILNRLIGFIKLEQPFYKMKSN
jgi:GTPase SAR1 family protein